MAKKPTVTTVSSGFASNTQLNANFTALRDAFDNTLSLDGSTPNAMQADLDLNGNALLNVGSIDADNFTLNGQIVTDLSAVPEWRSGWLTGTSYAKNDLVRQSGNSYICLVSHTSGTFSTDLSAGRWELFAEKGAAGAGTGDMLAANNLSDVVNKPAALATLGGQPVDTDLTALAGISATGFLARTGSGTAAARTITAGGGISVTNGDGVSGNPTVAVSGNLSSLAGLSLSAGDVLYATGANTVARLPIGTANQVLRVNTGATAPEWFTPATSGLTFSTAVTASGANVDIGSIPSSARRVTVAVSGLSHNSGTAATFSIQIGDSGGIETTGYSGTYGNLTGSPSGTALSASFQATTAVNAVDTVSGILTLLKLDAAANTWVASGTFTHNVGNFVGVVSGSKTLSDVLDRVRVLTNAGTFDAGTINVAWE